MKTIQKYNYKTLALIAFFWILFHFFARPSYNFAFNQINPRLNLTDTIKYTNGFDFPVGKSNAEGYYNAQSFGNNFHLEDEWNGNNGGNTDLGDTIYSIANGYVCFAKDVKGGWGNVIRILHYIDDSTKVESLYAHSEEVFVKKGQYTPKGTPIATIDTANGKYTAHLHFEIRSDINLPIGKGYSKKSEGYLNPLQFIQSHRN